MPLNIGNVNFGIDANTKGLQKAVAQLDAFQKKTDAIAKSQEKGAKATANAMGRQESAVKKAIQQTASLRMAMQKAGAAPAAFAPVTKALTRLTQEMTSGKLSTVQFTRSVDAFNARLGRMRRGISELKVNEATKKMDSFAAKVRNLESASVLAIGPLSGVGARIRAMGSIINRSNIQLAAMFAGVTAITVAVGKMIVGAVTAGRVWEENMARFKAATGSVKLAGENMAFVIQISNALGLSIINTARAFSRLSAATRGTVLEGKGVRDIFRGVSKAAAALRLNQQEVEGTFRAIEQMLSKGTVQAEELRGQLGERLPGAFRIAAEAMGTTTEGLGKMLKAGEVIADEFMPRFITQLEKAFGAEAKNNVKGITGATNLLSNQILLFSKDTDKALGVSRAWAGFLSALANGILMARFQIARMNGTMNEFTKELLDATAAGAGIFGGQDPGKLGKGFDKVNSSLDDMVSKLNVAQKVLSDQTGMDPKKALGIFEALEEVKKFNRTEVQELAKNLSKALGKDVSADIASVAIAMAEFRQQTDDAAEALNKLLNAQEKAEKAAAKWAETWNKDLIAAMKEGDRLAEKTAKTWANIFTAAMKEAERNAERAAASIKRTQDEMALLTKRIEALRGGREAFETFNGITKNVDRMRVSMEKAGNSQEVINNTLQEYTQLLKENKKATEQFETANSAAQAFGNTLEDMVFRVNSVSDAVRLLAIELAKLFFRQTVQNPLVDFLSQAFMGAGGGGGGTTTPMPISLQRIQKLGPTRASGGPVTAGRAFLVGEKGPESFIPRTSGTILPNAAMGGTTIVQHNDFRGVGVGDQLRIQLQLKQLQKATIAEVQQMNKKGTL